MREPIKAGKEARALWRSFLSRLWGGLRVIWPIVASLVALMLALGIAVGKCEGWTLEESVYFTFVSGLTIGYGDFVPTLLVSRILTILIGVCGLLLTALLAAISVKAMSGVTEHREQ